MCEKCYRRRQLQKVMDKLPEIEAALEIPPDEMEEMMRISRRMSVMTAEDWFTPICTGL